MQIGIPAKLGQGFRPTQKAYTSLLVACREAGDAERALEIFRLVQASETPPDEVFMRVLRQALKSKPELLRQTTRAAPSRSATRDEKNKRGMNAGKMKEKQTEDDAVDGAK